MQIQPKLNQSKVKVAALTHETQIFQSNKITSLNKQFSLSLIYYNVRRFLVQSSIILDLEITQTLNKK